MILNDIRFDGMIRYYLSKNLRHWNYVTKNEITTPLQRKIQQYTYVYKKHRDELIRDVLLWNPTHGRAKAGRPARTYIQQLCEDTGCCPEDLPRAMNDREEWRERIRDIRATSVTWWWWWWFTKTSSRKQEVTQSQCLSRV